MWSCVQYVTEASEPNILSSASTGYVASQSAQQLLEGEKLLHTKINMWIPALFLSDPRQFLEFVSI